MKDLLVIREYEFNGIKVWVKIDALKGQVSLMEQLGSGNFEPKRWLFAERELKYMNGWLDILDAMRQAIEAASAELQKIEDEKFQKTVELMQAVSEQEPLA